MSSYFTVKFNDFGRGTTYETKRSRRAVSQKRTTYKQAVDTVNLLGS